MQIYQWLALQAQTYFRLRSHFCWITYKRNSYFLKALFKDWLITYSFEVPYSQHDGYYMNQVTIENIKLPYVFINSSICIFLLHYNKSNVPKQGIKKKSNPLVMFWAVTVAHTESQPSLITKFNTYSDTLITETRKWDTVIYTKYCMCV